MMNGLYFYISGININTYQMGIEDFFEDKYKRYDHGHSKKHQDDHASHNNRVHDQHDPYGYKPDNDHGYDEHQHEVHRYQDGYYPREHHHDDHPFRNGYSQHGRNHVNLWQPFLAKVNSKPGLKFALIAGAVVVLLLLFALVLALFPWLVKLWDAFAKSGLQGILDNLLKG